jgi:mono/diheme cytochrome c family protein
MRNVTLAAFAAALLIGCGDKDDSGDAGGTAADAANGETLYSSNCVGCHAASGLGEDDGNGAPGATNLQEYAPTASEAVITDVILNGQGGMPAIGVSESEAADIAAYVKAEFGS